MFGTLSTATQPLCYPAPEIRVMLERNDLIWQKKKIVIIINIVISNYYKNLCVFSDSYNKNVMKVLTLIKLKKWKNKKLTSLKEIDNKSFKKLL